MVCGNSRMIGSISNKSGDLIMEVVAVQQVYQITRMNKLEKTKWWNV